MHPGTENAAFLSEVLVEVSRSISASCVETPVLITHSQPALSIHICALHLSVSADNNVTCVTVCDVSSRHEPSAGKFDPVLTAK